MIIKDDMINDVMIYIHNRFKWEVGSGEPDLYDPSRLFEVMKAVMEKSPIDDCYYGDVIIDHFFTKIIDPSKAREVDPSKYKMTREMYEYGNLFFNSQRGFESEFYDIFEISWARAYNEWADSYVTGKWDPSDWAGYMLDQLEDAATDAAFEKFPILELK